MRGCGMPSMGKAWYRNATSCPLAGKISISVELKPREGFSITWTPKPSARAYQGMVRSIRVASPTGWTTLHPSHIDPSPNNFPSWKVLATRHAHNYSLDPTTSKKITQQHINHRRIFERTNCGGFHPWPMPSVEQNIKHHYYELV